jgi:uncharacterized NAD(P)/FAD-binding protein YdhS
VADCGTIPPVVAIVGGGFSGAFCAVSLAAKSACGVRIVVIEPRERLGAGVAYSATDPAHRINVPAARMTLFPDHPSHFDDWVRARGVLAEDEDALWPDGHAYPRRDVFGRYMAELVERGGAAKPGIQIEHVRDTALAARASGAGFVIALAGGGEVAADFLVLAVSHPPPAAPALVAALGDDEAVIANPWVPGVLGQIPADNDVLIVGTGLTMADAVATLARQGHRGRITAFSRRGQMSRGHAFGMTPFAWFARNAAPRTALSLSRCIRARIAEAAAAGLPWQAVLDDVRANARKLWDALDETEKRRLLRHLRTFWDSHRYRVAPQVEQAVAVKRADGSLRVLAASPRRLARHAGRIEVTLHPRSAPPEMLLSFSVDTVIVTTGPAHGGVVAGNPVLASLAGAGLLRADALGLGVDVDEQSRVIGANGVAVARMFVAGPLARARFGELMGLPQVAAQPNAVAEEIAVMIARAEADGRAVSLG